MFLRKLQVGWALLPVLLPAAFLWPALSGRLVPSFRDQSDFFYPSHRYTAARLLKKELPLWNSLAGNGESWIGNGQNEIFYPPALAFFLPNGARAAGLFLFLHFALSYLLFFGFVRARGRTFPAAAAGAALYCLSGAAVSFSVFWNHFAGMAWIPAMAWAAQLGLKTRRQCAGFAAALSLALLAGSPEAALFGLVLSVAVFLAQWRQEEGARRESGDTNVRGPGGLVSAVFGGILLGAVGLLPLLAQLPRSAARSSIAGGGLSLRQIPALFTSPSVSPLPWLPAGSGFLQTLYVSLPLLAVAAAAFLSPERRAEKLLWAGMAVLGLVLALLPARLPFRYPPKFVMLSLFALALLVSEGFEALRFAEASRFRRELGFGLAGGTLVAALLLTRTPAERILVSLGGALTAVAAFDAPGRRRGAILALAAPLFAAHLACADLPLTRYASLAAFEEPPKPARGKVLTSQDDLLSQWANQALPDEEKRVRRQVDSLVGYTNLPFGVAKARSATALPSEEARAFSLSLENAPDLTRIAAVAGCGEVRFPRGESLARVLVSPTLSGASFFFREEKAPAPALALEEISSGHFDFSHVLFVDRPGGVMPSGKSSAVASKSAETPERIDYSVALSGKAWMYRAQSWDPWWRASVDGKPSEIVRADGVFCAVLVPAGDHRVVWEYRPWPFYAGAAVSAAALIVLIGLSVSGEPPIRIRRA